MSMIVARMQKMKAENLVGIGNHNQRKTKNHSNRGSPCEGTTRGKLKKIRQYP